MLGLRRVLIFNKEMAEQVKHFTDLKVWRKAHELFLGVLKDVEKFPRIRGAGVVADQIIRSVGSIGANIAEGFNSRTRKQNISTFWILLADREQKVRIGITKFGMRAF